MSALNFVTYLFWDPSTWHSVYKWSFWFILRDLVWNSLQRGSLHSHLPLERLNSPSTLELSPFCVELPARRCKLWSNHSDRLHSDWSSCFITLSCGPHQPLRCPRVVILDGQRHLKCLYSLIMQIYSLQCLLPLPILRWILKLHSPLRSSLHKRLSAKQTRVRHFWMKPKAPIDNSQVKRINFITMLLTHPFQSGLTLLFSKCYSPPASGTSHICIFIKSVCTVLNLMVTALLIPDSLWMLIPLPLAGAIIFSRSAHAVVSLGNGEHDCPEEAMCCCFLLTHWVWLCVTSARVTRGVCEGCMHGGVSRHGGNTGNGHKRTGTGLGSSTCLDANFLHSLSFNILIREWDKFPLAAMLTTRDYQVKAVCQLQSHIEK